MNDDRDRKSHRLAWSTAIAVLVVAFGAPLAGAAGLEVPQVTEVPLPAEELPLPDVPEGPLPEVEPPLPVPDVTTVPVPVEELTGDVGSIVDGVVDPVEETTGEVTDGVDDVTGGAGDVVDDVVDEVTDPEGPVGGVVDEVTDPEGPVGGVVDEVTDPDGPVGGVVDEVTDPKGPLGGAVDGIGKNVDSIVDDVGGPLDGFFGGLPTAPGTPAIGEPGMPGVDVPIGGGRGSDGVADTAEEAATLAERIAATVSPDGFAAHVLAAAETAASTPSPRDLPEPSLIEQIARSASEIAQKIAFPLLLALAVGAFVIVQDRVDRKDPKLALAAVDADEDLLGFE